MRVSQYWAGILAGGNGTRLHAFTKALTGDDRPKQFCRLLTTETLLGATRARLSPLVEPDRTVCVVTEHHAPFYRDELADMPSYGVIEQPSNRGTTAAIANVVARVAAIAPDAVLGLFPADHHYEDPSVLRQVAATTYAAADQDQERVFLIGAEPDRAETEYGYIERASVLPSFCNAHASCGALRGVARFVEKPSARDAASLIRRGCVWNTFVLVGHVRAFAALLNATVPGTFQAFCGLWTSGGHVTRTAQLYADIAPSDFSSDVLSACPKRLGVATLPPRNWTDLGQPSRVLEVMATRRTHGLAAGTLVAS